MTHDYKAALDWLNLWSAELDMMAEDTTALTTIRTALELAAKVQDGSHVVVPKTVSSGGIDYQIIDGMVRYFYTAPEGGE